MLIEEIYVIPEGRAAGSFRFLNLHQYMGITGMYSTIGENQVSRIIIVMLRRATVTKGGNI